MPDPVFDRLARMVEQSGAPFVLHEHQAMKSMADAEQHLPFNVARIVKTLAFHARSGALILAALRGTDRVDYPRLAALAGVNRRDLAPLAPDEVWELLGVEPGSVSPLPLREDATVVIDADIQTIAPTIYCGIGRPDRTLEIAPEDLVRVSGGRISSFSK
ncbi:MAG: YbaK/EbsC family protein [Desulfuromonadaceae bacterium]|nr:YbaK/EbsC family protein [Desulfuromonadaceae bacterium]